MGVLRRWTACRPVFMAPDDPEEPRSADGYAVVDWLTGSFRVHVAARGRHVEQRKTNLWDVKYI